MRLLSMKWVIQHCFFKLGLRGLFVFMATLALLSGTALAMATAEHTSVSAGAHKYVAAIAAGVVTLVGVTALEQLCDEPTHDAAKPSRQCEPGRELQTKADIKAFKHTFSQRLSCHIKKLLFQPMATASNDPLIALIGYGTCIALASFLCHDLSQWHPSWAQHFTRTAGLAPTIFSAGTMPTLEQVTQRRHSRFAAAPSTLSAVRVGPGHMAHRAWSTSAPGDIPDAHSAPHEVAVPRVADTGAGVGMITSGGQRGSGESSSDCRSTAPGEGPAYNLVADSLAQQEEMYPDRQFRVVPVRRIEELSDK